MSSIMSRAELRSLPMLQQPSYPDEAGLDRVIDIVEKLPPLVFAGECDGLRAKLAEVAEGRAFLLQGGDCAESFDAVTAQHIKDKLLVQLSMAVVMTYAAQVPVVKVGRIAGQYAKPRSKPMETRGETTLPSYRGDAINGFDFTEQSRVHDPERLIRLYNASAATLNLVRAFVTGGFADLRGVHTWNRDFVGNPEVEAAYEELAAEIDRALTFMVACGVDDRALSTIDFYASHEALLLPYEEALTRPGEGPHQGRWFGASAHMLWLGERTRQLDGAHIEYLRGIHNPIGVKVGPTATPDEVLGLMQALDPNQEPGRLVLITRMGAGKLPKHLPALVRAVKASGRPVIWSCDPMHGNTVTSSNGLKTRDFGNVVQEVREFFAVHEAEGTIAGGLHVELTGQDVTECRGGGQNLTDESLQERYTSACDPRLNGSQSLELAFLVADLLKAQRR